MDEDVSWLVELQTWRGGLLMELMVKVARAEEAAMGKERQLLLDVIGVHVTILNDSTGRE